MIVMDSNIHSPYIKMDYFPPSIIRQPPPPPAARKEGKIKPQMFGGISTYYQRSCEKKRKRLTDIDSLPDEVLFEVLVRLPAQDIYDSARLVCSKWYHIIHTHTFIYAHLQRSPHGLLFQSQYGDSFFMGVGESGGVEISKKRYNLRCPVQTSCNGLLLEFQWGSNHNLYVSNPATKQIFALPPFVGNIMNYNYNLFGIAYAAASMEYKAVVLASRLYTRVCILTIGVDNSWRIVGIGTKCASVSVKTTPVNGDTPLITEGFVHWCNSDTNEILTLNVETEIITETCAPIPKVAYRNRWNTYLSAGRYLSLFVPCGKCCWDVWEMKPKIDYCWRNVLDISLEAHMCTTFRQFGFHCYKFLVPIGWLKYLEVLVFGFSDPIYSQIFVYNLLTQEIVTIELPVPLSNYNIVAHKNSLVWLGGC